jgi:hypothetical protein
MYIHTCVCVCVCVCVQDILTHLARVLASVLMSCTQEDLRNELMSPSSQEHRLAAVIAHNWH